MDEKAETPKEPEELDAAKLLRIDSAMNSGVEAPRAQGASSA